jgi:protein SDA1
MAEDLFKQLQDGNERFEVKLLHLDVISRLIGIHELFVFSFYPYVTRFLQPHQRQVTRVLQFAAQAAHEFVPPEVIKPINKTIVNNFFTELSSVDERGFAPRFGHVHTKAIKTNPSCQL